MSKSILASDLDKALQSENPPMVFDVRKKPVFDSDPRMIPTAQWQVHDDVMKWASDLSQASQVVVYCVHGHAVSQNAAKALSEMGLDALYLEGGVVAWAEAGFGVS